MPDLFASVHAISQSPAEQAPPIASDLRALDRSMLSSMAWTGAAKWAVQTLSWTSTIVVVRLLSPADYGLVGMASVFLGVLQPLCDFGIGPAIVQDRHLTRDQIARLNGFALSFGLACSVLTAAMALPIAAFFHQPALKAVVPVMGLVFVCGALRVVPTALLARDMGFRRLAAIEAIEALVLLVATLGLALSGFGYWSLVVGPIVARTIGSALAVQARPTGFAAPLPFARIAGRVQFGAWVAASSLAWYAYMSADQIVVGRVLGDAALGAYTIGITLAAVPVEKISQLYQRVAGSVISQVQHDRTAVARYFLRIGEGVSIVTFPLSIGLALVADLFVQVVIGARWEAAVVPLRLLAAAAAIRSLDPLLAQVLMATGHARQNARTMIIAALVLPGLFLAGAKWGLAGVAAVWVVGHPAIVVTSQLHFALRVTDARLRDYGRALWPAASCTAVMALAVLGMRASIDHRVPPPVALAASIATGVVAYVAALAMLHPRRLRTAWGLLRPRTV